MNQTVRSFALACASAGLLLAACQPQAKPGQAVSAKPVTAPEFPTAAEVADKAQVPSLSADGKAVPPVKSVAAFLTANNLAPLWQADYSQRENNTTRPTILDGFYGADHRHISVIFEQVQRDATQPNVFRVQGRTRYKKNIIPFDGTITVEGIKPLEASLDLDSVQEAQAQKYTANARFVLRENPTANGAGTYQGTALMDFYRLPSGKLSLIQTMPATELPTGGGGMLFRGQWQSSRTGRQQAVAFANYPEAILPDAMADLYIGDRGETLNPKYAGLDWSEAWENDEWWAKSPKPSLSL